MRKSRALLVAVFVLALLGALLVGCSGQSASSSASGSSASASEASSGQTTEALLEEISAAQPSSDMKNFAMNMEGSMSIDTTAMMAEATGSSASSEAADSAASSEAAESSEAAAGSSATTIPIQMTIKVDLTGDATKMYLTMEMMGQNVEAYINGEDVVMVNQGQAIAATLDELNMSQYATPASIMKSQNVDVSALADAVLSVDKVAEGDKAVYPVVFDPEKVVEASDSSSTVSQLGSTLTLTDATAIYTVNADGQMEKAQMIMAGSGFAYDITLTITDIGTTVIPDAPEATIKYSDVVGSGAAASAEAASSEAAAA